MSAEPQFDKELALELHDRTARWLVDLHQLTLQYLQDEAALDAEIDAPPGDDA